MADEEDAEKDPFHNDVSDFEGSDKPYEPASSSLNVLTSQDVPIIPVETFTANETENGTHEYQTAKLGSEQSRTTSEQSRKSQEIVLNNKKTSPGQLGSDKSFHKLRLTRLNRQCQRRFREIIGKRESRNEELEKQHGDLRERLNILECSMPAVMVWNIWRMSQSTSVPSLQRVLEKQFQGPASGEMYCPNTPSRHFDCRVREVEAERKQAQKKMEEATTLLAEKMVTLEEKQKKLEEAKKIQEERKERMKQLTVEALKLREAASKVQNEGSCEAGECGAIKCKKQWLEKIPSSASIKSDDIECLEKLQQLAETELAMKRQIADLERREEAYMRTLQQSDQLWSKIESRAESTVSGLQEQLDMKTAVNQQMADRICQLEDDLEKMRTKLASCRTELEKFMNIEKVEALIGRNDDFAEVSEKETTDEIAKMHRMIGREDDMADVDDVNITAKEQTEEKEITVKPELTEVGTKVQLQVADVTTGVDRADLIPVDNIKLDVYPEDFAYESQRLKEAKEYLARLGSLSALDVDDDYICPPDFACNDLVLSETGLTEEELAALKENRVTAEMLLSKGEAAARERQKGAIKQEMLLETVKQETVDVEEKHDQGIISTVKRETSVGKTPPVDAYEERIIDEVVKEEIITNLPAIEEGAPDQEISRTEEVSHVLTPDQIFLNGKVEEKEILVAATAIDTDYTVTDSNNILILRSDLLSWQDHVDSIRAQIATEVKEIIEQGVSVKEEPKLEEEIVSETLVTEKDLEAKVETLKKVLEIEEVEVSRTELPLLEIAEPIDTEEKLRGIIEKEDPVTTEEVVTAPAIIPTEKKGKEPMLIPETEVPEEKVEMKVDAEIPPESPAMPLSESEKVDSIAIPAVVRSLDDTDTTAETVETVQKIEETEGIDETKKVEEISKTEETEKIEAIEETEEIVETEELKKVPEAIDNTLPLVMEEETSIPVEVEVIKEPVTELPIAEEAETKLILLEERDSRVSDESKTEDVKVDMKEKELPLEKEEVTMAEVTARIEKEEVKLTEELLPPVEEKHEAEVKIIPILEDKIDAEEEEEEELRLDEEVTVEEPIVKEEITELDTSELLHADKEIEVKRKMEEAPLLLEEQKVEVKVEILPDKEGEIGVTKETLATKEEEEIGVEVDTKEEDRIAEVEEMPTDEKVEVSKDELEELSQEKEVEVKLTVLPEGDKDEVEVEVLSEEVEKVVQEELEDVSKMESIKEKVAFLEEEETPSDEKVEASKDESGELSQKKEVEVKLTVLPEEDKDEVEVEVLPEEVEKIVQEELEDVPKMEFIKEKVALPEEGEMPSDEKVEVSKDESEEFSEEKEVEVKVTVLPEGDKVEVEVEVLPEDVEKVVKEELEDVAKMESVEEKVTLPEEEEIKELEEKIAEVPITKKFVDDIPKETMTPILEKVEVTIPSVTLEDEEHMLPCICEQFIPKELEVFLPPVTVEDKDSTPCMCQPSESEMSPTTPTQKLPTKIEVTQTEVTEVAKPETVQVIMQTVSDIATQTLSTRRIIRRAQPKLRNIPSGVDPESEILERLSRWRKPLKEQATVTTDFACCQTEKSSILSSKLKEGESLIASLPFSDILQSLKADLKLDPEQELGSVHYSKKSEELEGGKCNCCLCGKEEANSSATEKLPSSMFNVPSVQSASGKTGGSGIDHVLKHETFCLECKINRLQEALRSQDSSRQLTKLKMPMCSQQVCACVPPTMKSIPFRKQKIDQSCTAKIPKIKVQRIMQKELVIRKVNIAKTEKEIKRVSKEQGRTKEESEKKEEDKEVSVDCVCTAVVETDKPSATKKMRCACGDPD